MEMTRAEFEAVSALVTKQSGIKLPAGKEALVGARVARRLRSLQMTSFAEYLAYLRCDGLSEELPRLLDAISTNVTNFFREPDHFEYLRNNLLPKLVSRSRQSGRKLRIWSAGCSSGEEPYSIAIHLLEGLPDLERWDVRILATDLSREVLERAKTGVYGDERLKEVPPQLRSRYFRRARADAGDALRICDRARNLVAFAHLNLMERWPMHGPFDVIFCRNVMIYFDKPTQTRLVERFHKLLAPGGTLFIGHSESLTGNRDGFAHVRSTIYERR